jgi:hypothetical protein
MVAASAYGCWRRAPVGGGTVGGVVMVWLQGMLEGGCRRCAPTVVAGNERWRRSGRLQVLGWSALMVGGVCWSTYARGLAGALARAAGEGGAGL